MNTLKSVSELIALRTSRRTYQTEPLPGEIREKLELQIKSISKGPLGTAIDFALVNVAEVSNQKLKLGTYGFIQGARHFIAGQVQPSKNAFLDFGFTLEKLILDFTGMGLGTCWLGGTFSRSEFAKAINLQEGNVIPAITPVGYATKSRGLGERIIRLGAGSKNRLPHDQLFFDYHNQAAESVITDPVIQKILESVRLAPSASNNQPWRIVAEGNEFRFYISRKPGYQKAFSGIDLQMVDMGIAMAHFDLTARECHRIPEWKILDGTEPFGEWDYVISVVLGEKKFEVRDSNSEF